MTKIRVTERFIETPQGTRRFEFFDWDGPKDGIVYLHGRRADEIREQLPFPLVCVEDEGQWAVGKGYARADVGWLKIAGFRARAAWKRHFPMLMLRLGWILIMLGLAHPRMSAATLNSFWPVERWAWQKKTFPRL
jgi:hypothetical protein